MAQMYNPDEIISTANAMTEQSGELKNLIAQMGNIVSEMSSVWQSPAQSEFAAKFQDIEPQLTSFCTTVNSFAEKATSHANDVKASEGVA